MPAVSNEAVVTRRFRVPSQAEIAGIIAASGNPSLRNLKITLCYSELSRALAEDFLAGMLTIVRAR
jgi:hypothetical protein